MNYWLVKSEPESYAWSQLVTDGQTSWTGVRNYQARNHLRAMKSGDPVLFYHSVSEKEIVGLAQVVKEAYPDPTAEEGDWSCVDLAPLKPLVVSVGLDAIKSDKVLANMPWVTHGGLSVQPLSKVQFQRILKLGATTEP